MTQEELILEIEKIGKPKSLNLPIIIRGIIMLISAILIGIIWLLVIPWNLLIGVWFAMPLHSFDFIMQPYYWFEMARTNTKINENE